MPTGNCSRISRCDESERRRKYTTPPWIVTLCKILIDQATNVNAALPESNFWLPAYKPNIGRRTFLYTNRAGFTAVTPGLSTSMIVAATGS
jgi:hypothetical protein